MSLFEFLLVIFSIVLGLGITELLAGTVRILRHDLVAGRLHLLWVIMVENLDAHLSRRRKLVVTTIETGQV